MANGHTRRQIVRGLSSLGIGAGTVLTAGTASADWCNPSYQDYSLVEDLDCAGYGYIYFYDISEDQTRVPFKIVNNNGSDWFQFTLFDDTESVSEGETYHISPNQVKYDTLSGITGDSIGMSVNYETVGCKDYELYLKLCD